MMHMQMSSANNPEAIIPVLNIDTDLEFPFSYIGSTKD